MHAHHMQVEEVDIDLLFQHPDNANNGDVDAIEESIEINGFYSPLLVQRSTSYILAGNHRYLAAMRRGMTKLPVIYLDVDDQRAKRIMLSDNAITRRGYDDEAHLSTLLNELYATDEGLAGTGYTSQEYERLLLGLNEPLDLVTREPLDPEERPTGVPKGVGTLYLVPITNSDGQVEALELSKDGYTPITLGDFQVIRRALGIEKASEQEIDAFGVPSWTKKGQR